MRTSKNYGTLDFLDDIAEVYGMIDYHDIVDHKIYEMSKAIGDPLTGMLVVPVREENGQWSGCAFMHNVNTLCET